MTTTEIRTAISAANERPDTDAAPIVVDTGEGLRIAIAPGELAALLPAEEIDRPDFLRDTETALILRTCDKDRRGHGGFQWPGVGEVAEAPDYSRAKVCGQGLHGLLWGEGNAALLNWREDAIWLIAEVATSEIIDLDGKVKFRRALVLHEGDSVSATEYLKARLPRAVALPGSTNTGGDSSKNTGGDSSKNTGGNSSKNTGGDSSKNTGGDSSTNTGGNSSKNTGGNSSKNTGGDSSKNTGGDYSTNTGGDSSTNTGGYSSKNTGGNSSKNTGGDSSKNTGGDYSTNTGGYSSKNTGGNSSKNTGGDYSTNTGGYSSKNTGGNSSKNTGGNKSVCSGGDKAILVISWWDDVAKRERLSVGYVGENGIKEKTEYRLDDNGAFVEVNPSAQPAPAQLDLAPAKVAA
jgi:hypothetical protein